MEEVGAEHEGRSGGGGQHHLGVPEVEPLHPPLQVGHIPHVTESKPVEPSPLLRWVT